MVFLRVHVIPLLHCNVLKVRTGSKIYVGPWFDSELREQTVYNGHWKGWLVHLHQVRPGIFFPRRTWLNKKGVEILSFTLKGSSPGYIRTLI